MKSRLLIPGLIAALSTAFATATAVAADVPPTESTAPAKKAPASKAKVKPHSHAEANKQGMPPPEKPAAGGKATKPLHDHRKEHKP